MKDFEQDFDPAINTRPESDILQVAVENDNEIYPQNPPSLPGSFVL